jgi:hypothetical protein
MTVLAPRVASDGALKAHRTHMTEKPKVLGPASYFPSIEKTYGQPIEHWLKLLKVLKNVSHMAMVSVLKTKYGMGHGHANALVAYLRAK